MKFPIRIIQYIYYFIYTSLNTRIQNFKGALLKLKSFNFPCVFALAKALAHFAYITNMCFK